MLHIAKLAVGVRDLPHLREIQAARAAAHPPLRHLTRNFPRRAEEIVGQGSLFWVMSVRQRITGIEEARRDDGSPCTALLLDAKLIPVLPRPIKAFQGWRYLEAQDAPDDIIRGDATGVGRLPAGLLRELRELCLV
jgi:hypothetical protein